MATDKELLKAKQLALTHDSVRKRVTKHLRWALDTLEMFKARLPNDRGLAITCNEASVACRTSERLTDAETNLR